MRIFIVPLAAILVVASAARAAVVYNESSNGALSTNQAAPTPITVSTGVNSVIGSVTGGTNSQDWLTINVPAGKTLSSLVLASYTSTDSQGFMGVQAGASFTGSPGVASSFLGYSHFGTAATNSGVPTANLVGADLLPLMGNSAVTSPGSTGFTPPLGAGNYTFLFQQLGAATSYQFDFTISAIPEPASLSLLALGVVCLMNRRRRSSHQGHR